MSSNPIYTDFGAYFGSDGDDGYHMASYSDVRFPHVIYANWRWGGSAKSLINSPNSASLTSKSATTRIFIDQCGQPTLDWLFAGCLGGPPGTFEGQVF